MGCMSNDTKPEPKDEIPQDQRAHYNYWDFLSQN